MFCTWPDKIVLFLLSFVSRKSPNKITLNPGDELVVKIDPQGLLSPGMYARGEIILHDNFYEHRINIVLQSEFIEGQSSVSEFIGGPGQLFAISLALGGLWFLLSISSSNQTKIEPDSDIYENLEEFSNETDF